MLYLVDYENVNLNGLVGIEKLTEEDTVVIFLGNNMGAISFEWHIRIADAQAKVKYIKCGKVSKNYLDFQLATYCGYLLAGMENGKVFIVSKDKGYDSVIDFWISNKQEIQISRVESIDDGLGVPKQQAKNPRQRRQPSRLHGNRRYNNSGRQNGVQEQKENPEEMEVREQKENPKEMEVREQKEILEQNTSQEQGYERIPQKSWDAGSGNSEREKTERPEEAVQREEELKKEEPEARNQRVEELGIGEPEEKSREAEEPEAGEPEGREPEAGESEGREPEAEEPEAREPEAGEPEAGEPETGEPEAGEPEVKSQEMKETEGAQQKAGRRGRPRRRTAASEGKTLEEPVSAADDEASPKKRESAGEKDSRTQKRRESSVAARRDQLSESIKKRIRQKVKDEELKGGSYSTIYNIFLSETAKNRFNTALVKAFQQEKGNRIYKKLLPEFEEHLKEQ